MEKGGPQANLKTVHPYLEMEIVHRQQNSENLHLVLYQTRLQGKFR